MTEVHLEAETRSNLGRGPSKAVRKEARIPAVAYASGKESICITVPGKPLSLLYETGKTFNTKISLKVAGKELDAVIREIALHPVKDSIIHVDFQILKGEICKVRVPVRFIGLDICPGIKKGGFLNKIQRFIWMSCPSKAIPQTVDFDMSHLEVGQAVRYSDASIPPDCKIIPGKQDIVASILGKR